ncbi:MAG: MarR family transcriptional regulator [Mariprofundaceae bacterium]|nr:MarR family transcriptional regulator [Mariprofundaceae bacterium]
MKKIFQVQNRSLGAIMPLIGCMTSLVRYQVSCICASEGYKLTPEEADTLMLIHHCEGLPQSQLAKMLGKDKTSVTRLMNVLVKSGLVGRIQDKSDRRIVRACMTEEGKKAFTRIFPQLKALSEKVLEGLSGSDIDRVKRVITQMTTNLAVLGDAMDEMQGKEVPSK